MWTRDIQNVFKEDEIYSKNLKVTLGIYLDSDHILKCMGRLNNSNLPKYTRNPVLLPKDGHFTNLIINQAHQIVEHGGVKDTLTDIRSRFWIIQGRNAVIKAIRRCTSPCNRLESRPFKAPPPPPPFPDLPESRVRGNCAFEKVGVDYLGPLLVKQFFPESEDENLYKSHVVLFTCAIDLFTDSDAIFEMSIWQCIMVYSGYMKSKQTRYRTT